MQWMAGYGCTATPGLVNQWHILSQPTANSSSRTVALWGYQSPDFSSSPSETLAPANAAMPGTGTSAVDSFRRDPRQLLEVHREVVPSLAGARLADPIPASARRVNTKKNPPLVVAILPTPSPFM